MLRPKKALLDKAGTSNKEWLFHLRELLTIVMLYGTNEYFNKLIKIKYICNADSHSGLIISMVNSYMYNAYFYKWFIAGENLHNPIGIEYTSFIRDIISVFSWIGGQKN